MSAKIRQRSLNSGSPTKGASGQVAADTSKSRHWPRVANLSAVGCCAVWALVILRLSMLLLSYAMAEQADLYDDRDCKGVEREPARVCIVASEFEGIVPNGGIGTFYSTLAQTLVGAGHQVTLLFTQGEVSRSREGDFRYWQANYAGRGIDLVGLDMEAVSGVRYHATTSWAAFSWLRLRNASFDVIHFADFQGHGYYTVLAKYLGLSFANTTIVVTTHGPIRWALTANGGTLNSLELVEVDFLEQQSIRLADVLISPSRYLLQWQSLQGWTPRKAPRVMPLLLPQAARQLVEDVVRTSGAAEGDPDAPHPVDELVFFGRLEVRKGLIEFCDAVDDILLKRSVSVAPKKVTFLGSSRNKVDGRDSKEYVGTRAVGWPFMGVQVSIYDDKDTKAALMYLLGGGGRRCAVLPSRVENSPQAILELMGARVPFIASSAGGIPELIARRNHGDTLFRTRNASDLADRLVAALRSGVVVPQAARSMGALEQSWVNWHARAVCPPRGAHEQQTIGARLRGRMPMLAPPSPPPAREPGATKMSLFRNPLERIVSSFGHHPKGAGGLREQIHRMLHNLPLPEICGTEGSRMSDAISLSDVGLLDFVMITEQYDLGLVMMQRQFGWSPMDIMYLPLKDHSKKPELEQAMQYLRDYLSRPREQLSDVGRQVLQECIAGDEEEIYRWATERFEQQWSAVPAQGQQELQAEVTRFRTWQTAVQACCLANPKDEYCEFLSQDNPEWVFNHRPGHMSVCQSRLALAIRGGDGSSAAPARS